MILPALQSETPKLTQLAYGRHGPCESGISDELVLPEIWRMLRKNRLLIVGCTLAGLLLAGLYILLRSPRYEACARIEVSPAGTNSMGLDQLASKVLTPSDELMQLQSAVTVLQS